MSNPKDTVEVMNSPKESRKDVALTLPDGSVRTFDHPVNGLDLATDIGPGLAKAAIAVSVDGTIWD